MIKKTDVKKPPKKSAAFPLTPVVPTDYKILQELKTMNDILREIKDILDNTWRERRPQ